MGGAGTKLNSTPTEYETPLLVHSSNPPPPPPEHNPAPPPPLPEHNPARLPPAVKQKHNPAPSPAHAHAAEPYGDCILWSIFYPAIFIPIGGLIWYGFIFSDEAKDLTLFKPDVHLDSLFICPTDFSNKLMTWDLKLDFTNPNNNSTLFMSPLEVSVFPYNNNQTKLLTMAAAATDIIEPKTHGSSFLLTEASTYGDLKSLFDPITGTIHLDFKIYSKFHFLYLHVGVDRGGELVCRDVKVYFSSFNNSFSSCGSTVGDRVACSYQTYDSTRWSFFWDVF